MHKLLMNSKLCQEIAHALISKLTLMTIPILSYEKVKIQIETVNIKKR